MGKGKPLSEFEKKKILDLKKDNITISAISREINRSRTAITNFLKNTSKYGTKKQIGRPKILGKRTRKAIIEAAKGKNITANKIKAKLDLNVHKNTILNIIKNEGGLKRKKIKRKPVLKPIHKKNRLIFSGKYEDLKSK